ncbi:hypothetical protein [Sciscionella marina]|uniref:hypothetical protein n=1 Tax=Sciscionella marina TaxID=508770 RepID=UPI00037DACD6|nr:hypothetical protein [Sciscionella marina]
MIGVIVIGGRQERIPGDVGCAASFAGPVEFEVAEDATMRQVFEGREHEMLPALRRAGQTLVHRGAMVITTTCGLLTAVQASLSRYLNVPVITSALLQLPALLALLPPGQKIGVVTAMARLLTPHRIISAGVRAEQLKRLAVIDLSGTRHFLPSLTENENSPEARLIEQEVLACVREVLVAEPVGALLSECANLPPYSAALRAATGLPVWDAMDQIHWLVGTEQERFSAADTVGVAAK